MKDTREFQSWGGATKALHAVEKSILWQKDLSENFNLDNYLGVGLGRSYGDVCLNDHGTLLNFRSLNRIIAFNREAGELTLEGGVTLASILQFSVPRGFFLSVTPGTKFVTIGGAIANDVHGKNHNTYGTFGNSVISFKLLHQGEVRFCSPNENSELFKSTIGGLGLTGLILAVTIKLRPIETQLIKGVELKFANLDEFFALSKSEVSKYEFSVAWIDCLGEKSGGKGIFMLGNHATKEELVTSGKSNGDLKRGVNFRQRLVVPFYAPQFVLNPLTISLFNEVYYAKNLFQRQKKIGHFNPFFYPLDGVKDWNKMYGREGFYQFQCVIPKVEFASLFRDILKSKLGSFLAIIKEFGNKSSPGILSFPREGVTLALDFPNKGAVTRRTILSFYDKVLSSGGRIYPAKDALMTKEHFHEGYPDWQKMERFLDKKITSNFFRRVIQ